MASKRYCCYVPAILLLRVCVVFGAILYVFFISYLVNVYYQHTLRTEEYISAILPEDDVFSGAKIHNAVPPAPFSDELYFPARYHQPTCKTRKALHHSPCNLTIIALAGSIKSKLFGYRNFISTLNMSGYSDVRILPPVQSDILAMTKGNYSQEASFWAQRLKQFYDIANSFHASQILVFCDAFDVFFGQPPAVLHQRFASLRADVIFSTEMLCDTISCRNDASIVQWFISQSPIENPYKFLNAGMFMGTAQALTIFLQCGLRYAINGRDDQTAFSLCYRHFKTSGELRVQLDYDSSLFGNIPPVEDYFSAAWTLNLDIDTGPYIHRKNTFTSPVALHFPGMAYRPHDSLRFNQCQQHLRWRYNEILSGLFRNNNYLPSFDIRPPPPQLQNLIVVYVAETLNLELCTEMFTILMNANTLIITTVYIITKSKVNDKWVDSLYRATGISFQFSSSDRILETLKTHTNGSVIFFRDTVYQIDMIDRLVERINRDSRYVYTYGGGNIVNFNGTWKVVPSLAPTDRYTPIDIAVFSYGLILSLDMLPHSFTSPTCPTELSLDIQLSAALSQAGIPRLQIITDVAKVPLLLQSTIPPFHSYLSFSSCLEPLISSFRESWISSNFDNTCQVLDVHQLPHVPDLEHFSWAANWDINTFTSPCTHLLTAISDHAYAMGVGQFMKENQSIYSLNEEYRVTLLARAMMCIYHNEVLIRCVTAPSETSHHIYHALLLDGDLCFMRGERPPMTNRIELNNPNIHWCTSNAKVHRHLQQVEHKSKFSLSSKFNQVCDTLQLPDYRRKELYLKIENDGRFGLFYSNNIDPHDKMNHRERAEQIRLIGRCL